MNNLFSTIYESVFGLWNSQYDLIFQVLFDNNGYTMFGLTFLLMPLLFFIVFYLLWRYPYAKIWHWFLWLVLTSIVTGLITSGIAYNEIFLSDVQELNNAIATPSSGYEDYANSLPLKYALINGGLALALGFVYSLVLKQFSKSQIHLPF